MHGLIDLPAYLDRIGHADPLAATLETLRQLHARHLATIPFEAIDVLLGRGIDLSAAAVDAKIIAGGRGGYCFEQNGLFERVLSAIGFDVEPLIARVLWNAQPGAPRPPRSHMVLRVTIAGVPWLADVAFGGNTPAEPLRLDLRRAQSTRFDTYRLVPSRNAIRLDVRISGAWAPLYEMSREPAAAADFEVANWFTSTHPSSHFRQNLIAALTTADARYALLNNRLTIRNAAGEAERRALDERGIGDALQDMFGLTVEEEWRPIIARAAAAELSAAA